MISTLFILGISLWPLLPGTLRSAWGLLAATRPQPDDRVDPARPDESNRAS